jgi:hypothetical protein
MEIIMNSNALIITMGASQKVDIEWIEWVEYTY